MSREVSKLLCQSYFLFFGGYFFLSNGKIEFFYYEDVQ